jgi:hypothetical protein
MENLIQINWIFSLAISSALCPHYIKRKDFELKIFAKIRLFFSKIVFPSYVLEVRLGCYG